MFLIKNRSGNCSICDGTKKCIYCDGTRKYTTPEGQKIDCPSCKNGGCLCVERDMPMLDPKKTDLDTISLKNGSL